MFSGEVIYESWTLSFYNVFYTVLPPLAMGILDQFVSARLLDRYPQLYNLGQRNTFFQIRVFASWIITAVYHSIILYCGGCLFWILDGVQGDGLVAGHWVWGTAMYGAVLLTVLGKAALVTNNWTKYHVISIPGSMAIWIVFIAAYGSLAPKLNISTEYEGIVPRLFASPIFWLEMPALAILCLARDFAYKYAKRMWWPETYHHVQEIQKYNIQDYRPRYVAIHLCSAQHLGLPLHIHLTLCMILHTTSPRPFSSLPRRDFSCAFPLGRREFHASRPRDLPRGPSTGSVLEIDPVVT